MEDSKHTGRSTIEAGAITLHLDPDEEPYDEYPRVGIVARATLTVSTGTEKQALGIRHDIPLQSHGVWAIECPDLVAGCAIPEGSWVIGDYGNDQIGELQALIDVLTGEKG
jgi:hypothetical protein